MPVNKVIILTDGTSWTVPSDWTNTNKIEAIGSGGSGRTGSTSGTGGRGGGAGGAYTFLANTTLYTAGQVVPVQIGQGGQSPATTDTSGNIGTDTIFDTANSRVVAKGGGGGQTFAGYALGGYAGNCTPSANAVSGGDGAGGSGSTVGGGGGAAGGLHGAGLPAYSAGGLTTNTAGGATAGGAAGGTAGTSTTAGGLGASETDWTATAGGTAGAGSGGGGGGTASGYLTGGAGGGYGAGGGGGGSNGSSLWGLAGNGANGVIVITYQATGVVASGASSRMGARSRVTPTALGVASTSARIGMRGGTGPLMTLPRSWGRAGLRGGGTAIVNAFAQSRTGLGVAGILGNPQKEIITDVLTFSESLTVQPVYGLIQHLTVHQSDTEQYIWGRALAQNLSMHLTAVDKAIFSVQDIRAIKLASALLRAFPTALAQNLTVHQAQSLAVGLGLIQAMRLTPVHIPKATFHLGLTQALKLSSAFLRFIGMSLTQNLNIHPTYAVSKLANCLLAQNLTLHAALANTLVISLTGTIDLTEIDLMKAIYQGDALLDTVNLGALYVSPSGTITTWAVNTRTNAVTEYQNYAFNSFAQMGLRYIAASASGIYELDGEQDAGSPIPTELESGYLQMAGTKMAGIKACYVAIRSQGQILLKLTAGDGRDYLYQANVQPGLMNTKVNIGKGLFARYFAFNLQTLGPDFDLDGIEFVPMLRSRRV